VFDGSTFVTSDARGDLEAAPHRLHGFFVDDTRVLSRWILTLNGIELETLSVAGIQYFAASFFLIPPTGSIHQNPRLSVMRRRLMAEGWLEEIVLMNHADDPFHVELGIEAGTDFADLFEIKDAEVRAREIRRDAGDRELVLSYHNGTFERETRIATDGGCSVEPNGFRSQLTLAPREERRLSFEITSGPEPRRAAVRARTSGREFDFSHSQLSRDLGAWIDQSPSLETDWDELRHVYSRSLVDLAALRFYPEILPQAALPAAGLPWFMALFGRDSLIASYQALPFRPELARTTLLALADLQAAERDDFRDAEPGKILHELRFGELTVIGERPHSPYYGSADSTPLFLILLDEYERWTGDADLVRELEPNARAALDWIERHGDLDGDGYIEYITRNPSSGLANQCWKDSHNSILFADGRQAEPPIAVCEIQGYAYDAKRRCARLAANIWNDRELAERLDREAGELRRRFHEDFWLEDRGCYALALDRDKRRVDSRTSNIGHLLWSGMVEEDAAEQVAQHLMSDAMFSGWGIRTMAMGECGYNPVEYHNGTVWPHDTSLIAQGLARYGYRHEAARLAFAVIEAASHFAHRLPEVFAGYPRTLTEFPVQYPTASSPQAWASGAPLLLIRAVLGLEPDGDLLAEEAVLPESVERLELHGVAYRAVRSSSAARTVRPAADTASR
jgi:glycogen debranching enzyme